MAKFPPGEEISPQLRTTGFAGNHNKNLNLKQHSFHFKLFQILWVSLFNNLGGSDAKSKIAMGDKLTVSQQPGPNRLNH